MRKHNIALFISSMIMTTPLFAATPIDLHQQAVSVLRSFLSAGNPWKELSSEIDFKQTRHIRLQQMYEGYPVHGADFILHVAAGVKGKDLRNLIFTQNNNISMNGIIYQDLKADLSNAPQSIFDSSQAEQALQHALQYYQKNLKQSEVTDASTNLIIYIDKNNQAHWAYQISFKIQTEGVMPAEPIYILDAQNFKLYQNWNDIQTLDAEAGGGFGGNEKTGKYTYDGLKSNFAALDILRDGKTKLCYLENADVTVKDVRKKKAIANFDCKTKDASHNHVYWDASFDAENGALSPSNDALFVGKIVKAMYQQWYNIPVLVKNGKPMMLNMLVHEKMENAYWDGNEMVFGDGGNEFYPLVSLGVGAHEISHGFTSQHSNLEYDNQSGGLNESFSDMAAQAAEFYATGHNSWQIGPEIMKAKNRALRYMDQPSKDCMSGEDPGDNCSIDNAEDYRDGIDVHYSSGVFNKLFYLLATAKTWDTKKAFDVMVQANRNYWTATSDFSAAACGVIAASKDYGYNADAIKKSIASVGIKNKMC